MTKERREEGPGEHGLHVAHIVRVDSDRRVWVDLADGRGERPARLARAIARSLVVAEVPPQEVVVSFDRRGWPVIVDLVDDRLPESSSMPTADSAGGEMVIDADRLTFDAKEQLTFRCGKASVTLTRAGKVIIRGAYVSSTSTGINRINGGSVQIN